jgi:hypothetical protein
MSEKPTKWARVLAWLAKKRKDRRKTPKLRRVPKTRVDEPPVISLKELRALYTTRKPQIDKPRFRRKRKWFIREQMMESWRVGFNDRRNARKAAKRAAYLERTGQTAEEHVARVAARKAKGAK